MNRVRLLGVLWLAVSCLALAGCLEEIERGVTPTPRNSSSTVAPTATVNPVKSPSPTIGPTATPNPTPIPTSGPTPVPTSRPTVTPSPTVDPVPSLVLDVRGPADGTTVRSNAVVVYGTTTPGASININDNEVSVTPDGRFQAEVSISPGPNLVKVIASDTHGNSETRELTVTYLATTPQPFLLLITEPEDQSIVSERTIRLSGRTGSDAIVGVNGVSVSVDDLGFFSTIIILVPGPNIIDVVATNIDGKVLSKVIAVIYRP